MPVRLASWRASFFMLLKNILFPILLRAQEVKCWLRMSHFSAILYALNITCYVLTISAGDAFNIMILW
ncbi:hypothetical protein CWM59_14675 [Klebsiella sp. B-Nf7]|nr:hypothetical protein CWM59_14675 [Klebsiella sp. B-Nf7]